MESYRVLLAPEQGNEAGSLAAWLRRQGTGVSFVTPPETMGSGEVLSATIAGSAALRALVVIAQEWIRAHRTRISVQLEGRGSFEVEGTTDVDELVALLRESAPPGAAAEPRGDASGPAPKDPADA